MMNSPKLAAKSQEQVLVNQLLRLPLFDRMAGKQLQALLKLAHTRKLEPGEVLWDEGAEPESLCVLLRGRLDVTEDGETAAPGAAPATVGEVSLLGQQPRQERLAAAEDCLLLEFPSQALEVAFCHGSDICQRLCRNTVGLLAARLQDANDRLTELSAKRVGLDERIEAAERELNDINMIRRLRER